MNPKTGATQTDLIYLKVIKLLHSELNTLLLPGHTDAVLPAHYGILPLSVGYVHPAEEEHFYIPLVYLKV